MGQGTSRVVTMADVARHAGVSPATVSRALSGTRPMSPAIRTKVIEAADELGYRVNLVGRMLRQRRSSTAGLIVPDLDNPFFCALAQHLSRTFAPSGLDLMIFSADSDLETELRGVQSFVDRQVDALILIPCHEVESSSNVSFATDSVVTIQLDRRVPGTGAHFVGCDNRHGMQLVREHVVQNVDTDDHPVVYVGGDAVSSSGKERLEGFQDEFGSEPLALSGSFDAKWGIEAANQILDQGYRSGTVVVAADVIALGLMSQLHSRGFRVPEDFTVIGFDGVGVFHLAHPTLTTVRQPVEAMSQAIVSLVAASAEDRGDTEQLRLKPELLVGESSPVRAPS